MERVLTLILDRGVFGQDVFEKALVQQGRQLRHQQKRLLFEQEQADYQRVRRQKVIAELEDFEIRLKGA